MKCTCTVFLMLVAVVPAQDVNFLLHNKVLIDREIGCVLRQNPCDIIGKRIKSVLPEAVNNGCGRCTSQQASTAKKLVAFMKKYYPNEWIQINRMYSRPTSVY